MSHRQTPLPPIEHPIIVVGIFYNRFTTYVTVYFLMRTVSRILINSLKCLRKFCWLNLSLFGALLATCLYTRCGFVEFIAFPVSSSLVCKKRVMMRRWWKDLSSWFTALTQAGRRRALCRP
jgi:hypothetical protein